MSDEHRDFHGVLEHVHWKGPVALAPEAVLPAGEAIVAGEDHQGPLLQTQLLEPVQDPADGGVHGRNRGEIALQVLPVPVAQAGQRSGPGVELFLGAALEAAALVAGHDLFGVPRPGAVRSRVVNAEVEGVLPIRFQEAQRILGDHIRDVAPGLLQGAIPDHRLIDVGAGAFAVAEPVAEPGLRLHAVAQMPLAAQTAPPALLGQDVGVAAHALQVRLGVRRHVAFPDPVVNPVLGWKLARQDAGPGGRTDGGCTEEVLEQQAPVGQTVEIGSANLLVPVAARCPRSLVIRQDEYHVRPVVHLFSHRCTPMACPATGHPAF